MRYIKQTNIMKERERFEDALKKEEELKKKGLNVNEKKFLYFKDIESLQERVYDKSFISDNNIDNKYLVDRANYNPLSKRFRPFFFRPFYAKS